MNDRLRTAIARRELTLDRVAEHTGVDPKTVQRWIQGRVPHARHRWAVAALLKEDAAYLWPEPIGVSPTASNAELLSVYPHRADVPFDLWESLFERAEQQIDILVYAALFLHEQYPTLNQLLTGKCETGCRVRVLLGDADSRRITERGTEEEYGEGIESRCRVALRHYEPLIGTPNFELRLHDTTLYNSIYRFDTNMLVNAHVWGANAYGSPVLHLRQVQGGSLFAGYAKSLDAVWAAARPVEQATAAS
jgi:transcriptional regulator with XRE-family HTH domain